MFQDISHVLSSAVFNDTRRNVWHRQGNESNTFSEPSGGNPDQCKSRNPESNPGFFWLRLDALTEVCSFWVLYSFIMKLFTSCYCIIRWSTAVYVNMHCFVRKIISSWKFTEDRETSLSRIGYGQEYGLVSVFSSYCFKPLLCPSPVRYGITLTYAPNFNALLGVQLWFRATWHCTVWE